MRSTTEALRITATATVALLLLPGAALGYGGPGSVVTGIGALLAAAVAVVAAIFGFVWYPVKRLLRRFRSDPEGEAPESEAHGDAASG